MLILRQVFYGLHHINSCICWNEKKSQKVILFDSWTYLKNWIYQLEPEVTKVSVFFIYASGPGKRKTLRKQLNPKDSCSNIVRSPSKDCTHMKSRFSVPPKWPTVKFAADLFKGWAYINLSKYWIPGIFLILVTRP